MIFYASERYKLMDTGDTKICGNYLVVDKRNETEDGIFVFDTFHEALEKFNQLNDENEFVDYVLDFYGKNGIYDICATKEEVIKATNIRKLLKHMPLHFDTIDRELVRDIILTMRSEQ